MLGNIYSHYQLPMGYELWTVDCVCWTYQDHPRSDEVDKTISLSLFTWKLCSPLWGCVLPLLVRGNNHNAIYKLLLITSCHWCLPKILGSLNINFFKVYYYLQCMYMCMCACTHLLQDACGGQRTIFRCLFAAWDLGIERRLSCLCNKSFCLLSRFGVQIPGF